jgi:enamine deaminase RidA (YjgF/YER057c/UK114 family)
VAAPLVFVIGVRGLEHPITHEVAPEEVPGAFEAQLFNSFEWLSAHAGKAGTTVKDFVRMDACIRDINQASTYRERTKDYLGGIMPFAGYAVGVPLGARLEQEIGGIAVAPGVAKEVAWYEERPDEAQSTRAGGLVFASGCSGLQDARSGRILTELCGDKAAQARQALRRVEAGVGRFGVGLENLLRLDVYLRDIYFEDAFIEIVRDVLGRDAPAMTVLGGDLEFSAEIEIAAIAAA